MALPAYLPVGSKNVGTINAQFVNAAGTISTSVANTLTAHAGGTQALALPLPAQLNIVTVCATSGDSVVLPADDIGATIAVFNKGVAPMRVFAPSPGTIDGVATATGVVLTNGLRAEYTCIAPATWISDQLGAVSA